MKYKNIINNNTVPDALTPKQTLEKAYISGVSKTKLTAPKCFLSAMLAGAFIAFGATFFCVATSDNSLSFTFNKMLGGLCFCLGLELVLLCGAELFTGNILMCQALASHQINWKSLFKNWGLVLVGNALGALFVVALIALSQLCNLNSGNVGENIVKIATGKIELDWLTIFVKGMLCNMLVCLAVWIGFTSRTVVDKVAGILLPISGFVVCGFEHCVANMFFLPMGFVANALGYGIENAVTIQEIFYNLSASVTGNVAGGLLIAMAYWFIYSEHNVKKQQ